jgi:hypothetical protein
MNAVLMEAKDLAISIFSVPMAMMPGVVCD